MATQNLTTTYPDSMNQSSRKNLEEASRATQGSEELLERLRQSSERGSKLSQKALDLIAEGNEDMAELLDRANQRPQQLGLIYESLLREVDDSY